MAPLFGETGSNMFGCFITQTPKIRFGLLTFRQIPEALTFIIDKSMRQTILFGAE